MSWRGSFVTNFIYSDNTFYLLKKYLEERFTVVCIGDAVIAGHTREIGMYDSYNKFDDEYRKDIEEIIDSPVQIAVLTDDDFGDVFHYEPSCPEYQARKKREEERRLKEKEEREAKKEEEKRAYLEYLRTSAKEITKEEYEENLKSYGDQSELKEFFKGIRY